MFLFSVCLSELYYHVRRHVYCTLSDKNLQYHNHARTGSWIHKSYACQSDTVLTVCTSECILHLSNKKLQHHNITQPAEENNQNAWIIIGSDYAKNIATIRNART